MKLQRVLMLTGCSAWMVSAATGAETPPSAVPVPDPADQAATASAAKPVDELIRDLADPKFRTREYASRGLWTIGEAALGPLKEAARAKDPEQAFRARELLRKIQLFITPDTDAEVIAIVERYEKAPLSEKVTLFSQLHQKRAWRQMLKLYASETDGQVQMQIQAQGAIEGIPVTAARECLGRGDAAGAREYLEMAPADAPGLLSLAEFHRTQGTLEQELQRAKKLEGRQGAAWRLALFRASGNLDAARDAATEAGEPAISAALSVLLGDPLPWIRRETRENDPGGVRTLYTELAAKRWQGSNLRPSDLEPLVKALGHRNRVERNAATGALILLAEAGPAEKVIVRNVPLKAFSYFESQERIPEAIKVLGLNPEKPDYENWVRERVEKLTGSLDELDEDSELAGSDELIALAGFLERRGLHETCEAAFTRPLENLAGKDEEIFLDLLSSLFIDVNQGVAPGFASKFAATWAGQDDIRWDDLISAIFSEREEMISFWLWLEELDPKTTRAERLDAMLALCGLGTDPGRLKEKWSSLAWAALEHAPKEKRPQILAKMMFLVNLSSDADATLKLWDVLPEENRNLFFWQAVIRNLSAAERWQEASDYYLKIIENIARLNIEPQPEWHAGAAASLRHAGRPDEAAKHDAIVEKIALGRDAMAIAEAYAYCHDYERATRWWTLAALQADPDSEHFGEALEKLEGLFLEQGRWKEAAAIAEAQARNFVGVDVTTSFDLMLSARTFRLNSDMARAFSRLKEDRAGSVVLLENCFRLFPADASLADYFFPGLRKVGLIKEHDAWFRTAWDRIMAIVDEFPEADNSSNSAGWLAARAQRKLDEAETLLEKSLSLKPDQPAYLDTMAEIQFAKGNRAKALEWSARAINFYPNSGDSEVFRRQHERFRTAPLPR